MSDQKIQAFLDELAVLSHKHGLGINSKAELFEIEEDDAERLYHCNDDSVIDFY